MSPNPQETADLVTFTEEILNGKVHFLYSEPCYMRVRRSDVIKWNVFVSAVTVTCVLFNLYVFEFPF